MSKKKINICLTTSAYSYFLFLLINGYDEGDIIIVHESFPQEISKNINTIRVPLIEFKYGMLMEKINSIKGVIGNIRGYCKYFFNYIKLRLILFIKTFNKDIEVYGHAFSPFSFMFYENENSNIIEDGLMNYTAEICETHKINPLIDKFLHFCGIYFLNMCETQGTHKNIKNVYLTQEYYHPLIQDKINIIDMNKLWKNLSSDKQKEILDIFNINLEKFKFKGKTALILTQPFYQDGNLSLESELNIYQEIMGKFHDYSIIIKPHPREEKDFKEIFPNVEVIDRYFPIELLSLIGIEPTVVCSVVSTALLNFKNSEIYVYEGKLENKYLNELRNELLNMIKNLEKNN